MVEYHVPEEEGAREAALKALAVSGIGDALPA